jgi:hypothetical protein
MAGKGSRGRRAGGTPSGGKRPAGYRMADTTLDGTLPEWPPEPPRAPRNAVEAARLALIASPGEVHQLAWKLNDVGRAARLPAGQAVHARPHGHRAVRGSGLLRPRVQEVAGGRPLRAGGRGVGGSEITGPRRRPQPPRAAETVSGHARPAICPCPHEIKPWSSPRDPASRHQSGKA